jgi:hypothetical protein
VTLFDKLVSDVLGLRLKDTMPNRVLPVSPKPPRDFGLNLDAEFGEIAKMVRAGVTQAPRREGPNPVDRDPSMLLDGRKSQPSDRELDGIVRRIRDGAGWRAIFPALQRCGSIRTRPGQVWRCG